MFHNRKNTHNSEWQLNWKDFIIMSKWEKAVYTVLIVCGFDFL